MNRLASLAMICSCLMASLAIADDAAMARNVARKDYQAAGAKIRSDDSAAIEKCRSASGSAVEACLIQARGKRMRAERAAKTKLDQTGRAPSLPDAKKKAASQEALDAAKKEQRDTVKGIETEAKAADTECKKLTGAERKTCTSEVTRRRDDARDLADAIYKKARSDTKAMKAP